MMHRIIGCAVLAVAACVVNGKPLIGGSSPSSSTGSTGSTGSTETSEPATTAITGMGAKLAFYQQEAHDHFFKDLQGTDESGRPYPGVRDDDIHVTPLYELNRRCGTKIQVKSDFSKYTHNLVQQHKHWSIDSGCDSVMTGIGYLCDRDDAEKREVQSRVKVINCVWGTETHPKASDDMRLENGVFTFFLDTKPSDDKNAHYNVDQFTLHFMEDKLREE